MENELSPAYLHSIINILCATPPILRGIHNPYISSYAIITELAVFGNFDTQDLLSSYKSVSQVLTTINGSFYKKIPVRPYNFFLFEFVLYSQTFN